MYTKFLETCLKVDPKLCAIKIFKREMFLFMAFFKGYRPPFVSFYSFIKLKF